MAGLTEIERARLYIYNNSQNYQEEIVHSKGKKCYIFFSSNGLYEEKGYQDILKKMLIEERYEWKSIARSIKYHRDLGKIVYVRDINKSFYLDGISASINSIEKLLELLNHLVEGYIVTTVGVSSGGYLAVIAGIYLKAERIFNFSGQYNLEKH